MTKLNAIDTIGLRVIISLNHQNHNPNNSQNKIRNQSKNLSLNNKNQNRNQSQSHSLSLKQNMIIGIRVPISLKKNIKRKKKRRLILIKAATIHGISRNKLELTNNPRVSMIKILLKICKTDWKSSRRSLTIWKTGYIRWVIPVLYNT